MVFKKQGQLNKKDWDAVLEGLENVVELYLQKIVNCSSLYEELIEEEQLSEEELDHIWVTEWPDIKKMVVENHFTQANVTELAERILTGTYGTEIELANCGNFTVSAVTRLEKLIWNRRRGNG